ncbi:hypothetical protein [Halomarina ordinaria]|uniref:Uncharacterized protein n=1 Tax=Halomarina ordinaria TaxID=3033939 RepID=A0ABD5U9W9_9EURY|nr:hypothetical protein [Halomarina sp. PSRA2]
MSDSLADRVEGVLADAGTLFGDEDGEESGGDASDALRETAEEAAAVVEEADSVALLEAVGVTGPDGEADYGSIPEALAEGDEGRVLDLERLLKLSKLSRSWDDDEAASGLREELTDLFADGEATEEEESTPDDASDGTDEDAESEAGAESSPLDSLRNAVDQTSALLDDIGDDEDEAEDAEEDDAEDEDKEAPPRFTSSLSTMPSQDSRSDMHSTMPRRRT